MRTLKFIVDRQIIKKDPSCDFDGIVPGTKGYLQAEFAFSPEWVGTVKVASFLSPTGVEYSPQVLENGRCIIPSEALEGRRFKIQVLGKRDDFRIVTNKVTVSQNGGKA